MIEIPTLHLRLVERMVVDHENSNHEYIAHKPTQVLQQFWEHPNGMDAAGDMFKTKLGWWRDVPVVREAA